MCYRLDTYLKYVLFYHMMSQLRPAIFVHYLMSILFDAWPKNIHNFSQYYILYFILTILSTTPISLKFPIFFLILWFSVENISETLVFMRFIDIVFFVAAAARYWNISVFSFYVVLHAPSSHVSKNKVYKIQFLLHHFSVKSPET